MLPMTMVALISIIAIAETLAVHYLTIQLAWHFCRGTSVLATRALASVPGGEELMKSDVHQSGIGSSGRGGISELFFAAQRTSGALNAPGNFVSTPWRRGMIRNLNFMASAFQASLSNPRHGMIFDLAFGHSGFCVQAV